MSEASIMTQARLKALDTMYPYLPGWLGSQFLVTAEVGMQMQKPGKFGRYLKSLGESSWGAVKSVASVVPWVIGRIRGKTTTTARSLDVYPQRIQPPTISAVEAYRASKAAAAGKKAGVPSEQPLPLLIPSPVF